VNCQKGDLAYIFRSEAGNYGKTVTCIRLAEPEDFARDYEIAPRAVCWIVDRDLLSVVEGRLIDGSIERIERPTRICPDAILRPIRDPGDDAVDETLLMFRIPEFDTV
jgi:hypothetical protein